MKERPILFSAPMVKAILDGRKTMTRRVFKNDDSKRVGSRNFVHVLHGKDASVLTVKQPADAAYAGFNYSTSVQTSAVYFKCPYGQPGDRLWVRETWGITTPYDELRYQDNGVDCGPVWYRADGSLRIDERSRADLCYGRGKWRPSIFMPRWASRIDLKITGVRVERLNDISEDDAKAEGCTSTVEILSEEEPDGTVHAVDYRGLYAVERFQDLWGSINGKTPGKAWADNPYVWVVEFKRIKA